MCKQKHLEQVIWDFVIVCCLFVTLSACETLLYVAICCMRYLLDTDVFINVVYWNAVAPGVLIHTRLSECVFVAVRLLICTTPNSVYSCSKSVKSQV